MSDTTGQWIFRAHVLDRAGALTSIASAFSNDGVSIDTVVGHGFEERAGVDGSVVLTFCCTRDEKDKMVRKVRRLGGLGQGQVQAVLRGDPGQDLPRGRDSRRAVRQAHHGEDRLHQRHLRAQGHCLQ